jgi:hypothetical protein
MKILNFNNKLKSYFDCNSSLNAKNLEILLLIDSLYNEIPNDLGTFREIYAHFNPSFIHNSRDGITFLKIAKSNRTKEKLKSALNKYLNIKFNDIENTRSYESNMIFFKNYSVHASRALEEILKSSMFPDEIINILTESNEVKNCYDIYQMLQLYRNTLSDRIKYELLRKLGLITLIARINKSINIKYLDDEMKNVINAFNKGLGFNNAKKGACYLWLDHQNNVKYSKEKDRAAYFHNKDAELRKNLALEIYPIQELNYYTFETHSKNKIINFECRNKFKKDGQIYYASFIEKMIRKNLEFPDQIHDIMGIKIVVKNEDNIKNIIYDLENFLGGSSTRKREKNTYHRFNKRTLNKYSSENYYVWKAIYDITLSHPLAEQIKNILNITKDNNQIRSYLNKKLEYLLNNPRDFIIEVQLQDLETYFRSITCGSPTDHRLLKMSQIRNNSFYKLFPKEIYEKEILDLKFKLLNKKLN